MKRNLSGVFGLPAFKRVAQAVHDLSCRRFWTTHIGQIRPAWFRLVYPGDRFRIQPHLTVETNPTVLRFYGRMTAHVDYYYVPLSMFYGWIDNDTRLSFDEFIKFPRWDMSCQYLAYDAPLRQPKKSALFKDQSAWAFGPGSIFDHCGAPTVRQGALSSNYGQPTSVFGGPHMAADPMLAYYAIYRHFYANPQFPNGTGYFGQANTSGTSSDLAAGNWGLFLADSRTLDALFMSLRSKSYSTASHDDQGIWSTPRLITPGDIDSLWPVSTGDTSSDKYQINTFLKSLASHLAYMDYGLLNCQYHLDYFRGRISSSNVSEITVQNSDGTTTVNNIRYANKMQKFADKFAASSGRISDWIRSIWPTRISDVHRPEYLGGFSTDVTFTPIFQTAPGTSSQTDLGTKINYGTASRSGRSIYCKAPNYGIIMAVSYIRPETVYGQIVWPEDEYMAFGDLFSPDMANLGYQPLPEYRLNPFLNNPPHPTEPNTMPAVLDRAPIGYELSWIEGTTDVDRCYGLFKYPFPLHSLLPQFLPVMAQRSASSGEVSAYVATLQTYVRSDRWNQLFADTSAESHNVYCCLTQQVRATRSIPYRNLPTL